MFDRQTTYTGAPRDEDEDKAQVAGATKKEKKRAIPKRTTCQPGGDARTRGQVLKPAKEQLTEPAGGRGHREKIRRQAFSMRALNNAKSAAKLKVTGWAYKSEAHEARIDKLRPCKIG